MAAARATEGAATASLRVERWQDLDATETEVRWLVRDLLTRDALAFLASHPKAGKSMLALDLAVAVGAREGGTFLGFPVDDHGPALVFCAEDRLPAVRHRLARLHRGRGLVEPSDVRVICESRINLDDPPTLARLRRVVERVRPRLLVIDPLRRVTEADENDATAMAGVLGALRAIQRDFETTVLVLHHFKKQTEGVGEGQQMRGSSDIFAAGDAYLLVEPRREGVRRMTVQLREALPPEPFEYRLEDVPDGEGLALRFERVEPLDADADVRRRICDALAAGPKNTRDLESAVGGNREVVRKVRQTMVVEGQLVSVRGKGKETLFARAPGCAHELGHTLGTRDKTVPAPDAPRSVCPCAPPLRGGHTGHTRVRGAARRRKTCAHELGHTWAHAS